MQRKESTVAGIELGTTGSLDKHPNHWAIEALSFHEAIKFLLWCKHNDITKRKEGK